MKKLLLSFLILMSFSVLQSKAHAQGVRTVLFADCEVQPEFPGGPEAQNKHLTKSFKLPETEDSLAGSVIISFTVEIDGSLSAFKVVQDVGLETGNQLISIFKNGPKWSPGTIGDEKVRVMHRISMKIKLN